MRFRFLIPLLGAALLCMAAAGQFATPTARVKDSVDRVVAILKDQTLTRETKWERIAEVIDDGFDFRSMSQSVLATHWQEASQDERERFVQFFSQYIEETYRAKIEAYTDQKVEYKDEVVHGDRAVVKTVIVTERNEIPIDFKLKDNGGEWFAYDVVIEGVSLVANYRSTFAAIAKNEGMDGLLADIQERIAKYKREHGDLPDSDTPMDAGGSQ